RAGPQPRPWPWFRSPRRQSWPSSQTPSKLPAETGEPLFLEPSYARAGTADERQDDEQHEGQEQSGDGHGDGDGRTRPAEQRDRHLEVLIVEEVGDRELPE